MSNLSALGFASTCIVRALSLADSILSGALSWEPDPVRERSQFLDDYKPPVTLAGKAYLLRIEKTLAEKALRSSGGEAHQEANQAREGKRRAEERIKRIETLVRELKDSGLDDYYLYYYVGERLWAREGDENSRESTVMIRISQKVFAHLILKVI